MLQHNEFFLISKSLLLLNDNWIEITRLDSHMYIYHTTQNLNPTAQVKSSVILLTAAV